MRRWEGHIPVHAPRERLDRLLAGLVPGVSRAEVQRLLRGGHCTLNGHPAKPSERPPAGAIVVLDIVEPQAKAAPQRAPLQILYEDEHILAVDKPAGMVSHPARGSATHTLINALVAHLGGARATLISRLDRNTSGVILAAKTIAAHRALKLQMEKGALQRTYLALVRGHVHGDSGTVSEPLARDRSTGRRMVVCAEGKPAVTHWRVRERRWLAGEAVTLLEVCLETGRTHQIRVHMEWLGHPLVGDSLYHGTLTLPVGADAALVGARRRPGQALHSWRVEFDHPLTGKRLCIESQPDWLDLP